MPRSKIKIKVTEGQKDCFKRRICGVRVYFPSTPETFGKWTDGRILLSALSADIFFCYDRSTSASLCSCEVVMRAQTAVVVIPRSLCNMFRAVAPLLQPVSHTTLAR